MKKTKDIGAEHTYVGADRNRLTNSASNHFRRSSSDERIVPRLNDNDYASFLSKSKTTSRDIGKSNTGRDYQRFVSYMSHLKTLFKATPENPQTKEQALQNIKKACCESRRMTVREFVTKHNPTWYSDGKIDIDGANLHGIQTAQTNIGVVDIDWAITLAGFNLGLRICIFNAFLYAPAKPLWNLTRSENVFYTYFHEDERRAILTADQMTLCGKRFHQFFPSHYG